MRLDCPGGQRPMSPAVAVRMALSCAVSQPPRVGWKHVSVVRPAQPCTRFHLVRTLRREAAITIFGDHPNDNRQRD
jgi:hypothetical protein